MIAIIDYDIGNIGAVENMLLRIGAKCKITSDASEIEAASGLILPGNGAFDACVSNLRASGLIPLLEKQVFQKNIPILGICVGAQMLGHGSEEGNLPGLGWLDMVVKRLPENSGLHVPHMGWGEVVKRQVNHPLLKELEDDARYYFVHSYYMESKDRNLELLGSAYGIDFCAAVAEKNIMGVQFHPEKSHRYGKRILANFSEMQKAV
ncbi:imidazole glycerol phosphate synthase subunit HisH [Variovorax sp. RO1]|uniref:imidazole glycerol phosphate synthase subunit HisH n=1 Tax=Variovorax sp. RO1 TaxID=2066034 RepID=UPI000C7166A6|nr:imidazole glycerol phosphate synthase subunit HisH [Variovorax sp. RO1]PLC05125.1 imidazole glycerol phosphate synthase subunit HisH [Variovorax sp. RO1]